MTYEQIMSILESLKEEQLLEIWNYFCQDNARYDDMVYELDEDFFESHFDSPYESVRATLMGEVSFNDTYIKFNAYGNLESFSNLMPYIYLEDMVEHFEENPVEFEDYLITVGYMF